MAVPKTEWPCITDTVVDITPEGRLTALDARQRPTDVLGAFTFHLCDNGRPLQALATFRVPRATGFDLRPGVERAIIRGGQVPQDGVRKDIMGCDTGGTPQGKLRES